MNDWPCAIDRNTAIRIELGSLWDEPLSLLNRGLRSACFHKVARKFSQALEKDSPGFPLRTQDQRFSLFLNLHLAPLEMKFFWDSHGLTITALEHLCCFHLPPHMYIHHDIHGTNHNDSPLQGATGRAQSSKTED